jgi:hypothetical protein
MIISVVNFTRGRVPDADVLKAIRAINRQIEGDFAPHWSFGATLRLEGPVGTRPKKMTLPEMRGDAVLYLWDRIDVSGADGYHETNLRGIPYGVVYVELAQALDEPWTVTFSHEALELVGDPQANLLAQGPRPKSSEGPRTRDTVYHWVEMCDAVQDEKYAIDGVDVANFVLPLYFTRDEQVGGRNDFLGTRHDGKLLTSFGINPGGYVGYFDPRKGLHGMHTQAWVDVRGKTRLATKRKLKTGRGSLRNKRRP